MQNPPQAQPQAPQAPPEIGPIDLTEWQEEFNVALLNGKPALLVSADKSGHPDIAHKGSLMIFDKEHVAWWERSRAEQLAQVEENPNVAVFYRNTDSRLQLRLYGVAEIHRQGTVREEIMGRTHQRELDQDPERTGFGVLARVDRVRLGRNTIQERSR